MEFLGDARDDGQQQHDRVRETAARIVRKRTAPPRLFEPGQRVVHEPTEWVGTVKQYRSEGTDRGVTVVVIGDDGKKRCVRETTLLTEQEWAAANEQAEQMMLASTVTPVDAVTVADD